MFLLLVNDGRGCVREDITLVSGHHTRPDDTGPGWSRSVQVRDSDIMIIVIIALSLVECVEPPGSAELS